MKIPEKWGIKITSKNRKTVENWRTNGGIGTNIGYCLSSHFSQNDTRGYWVFDLPKGYTEITFEQFQQYILKEKSQDYNYLIPIIKKLNKHVSRR